MVLTNPLGQQQHLLSTHYVPGKFRGTEKSAINKQQPSSPRASVLVSGDQSEEEMEQGRGRGRCQEGLSGKVLSEQEPEGNEGRAFQKEGPASAKALRYTGEVVGGKCSGSS